MSVGRRRYLLPFAFLGVAACFTSAAVARAQQAGDSHKLWNEKLTQEQIKAALAKLSLGGEDENDPLHKMLREQMQKDHPEFPKALVDYMIKKSLSDPKFLELAAKKAQEKQTQPGRTPKFDQEDLAKLVKSMPRKVDPKELPDHLKPKLAPSSPSKAQPAPPPTTKGQLPPVTTDPPQPAGGGVLEPKMPDKPKGGPSKGIDDPTQSQQPGATGTGAPPAPATPEDTLFRPPDEPTDPRTKSLQAFAAVWERNIGPLDQTPEVKKALFDLASGANGLNLDLLDDKGNSVWDLLRKGDGSGLEFGDFMDGSGGNWKLPNFEMPSMKMGSWFGRTSPREGSSSSSWNWGGSSRQRVPSSGGSGFGSLGFGGSWFPVVVLAIIVLAIVFWIVWKNLRTPEPEVASIPHGLGPWPIDPRRINTREDVVKAFEYLSVLICGPAAKTWTHNTIADSLAELAATHGETAVMLARLYELARYAPLDEPLTHEEVMEARELVCGLAGVSY